MSLADQLWLMSVQTVLSSCTAQETDFRSTHSATPHNKHPGSSRMSSSELHVMSLANWAVYHLELVQQVLVAVSDPQSAAYQLLLSKLLA